MECATCKFRQIGAHLYLNDSVDFVYVLHPHAQHLVEPPLFVFARHIQHSVLTEHSVGNDVHFALEGPDESAVPAHVDHDTFDSLSIRPEQDLFSDLKRHLQAHTQATCEELRMSE